jgi:hypothetical protein
MDEKIYVRRAFRAFGVILAEGKRVGNEYHLNGLVAYADHDGYTVTIRNDYVQLDVFFHNKFSFNYSSRKEKSLFLEKINALDRSHDL